MNLNYRKKRIVFSLIWVLLNMVILSAITINVLGTPLEFLWFTGLVLYTTSFWILTSMLLDKILGYGASTLR